MRIALVIPSLSRDGGTERIACFVANGLVEAGHDVVAITRNTSTFDQQPLDASVERRQLYVPRGPKVLRNVQLPFVVNSLRKSIQSSGAQIVIGARWDCAILSLLAARSLDVPVIAWEHVYLPVATLSRAWKTLRRLTYRRAAALVLVNDASVGYARTLVEPHRVHVIRNFISEDDGAEDDEREPTEPSKWSAFVGGAPKNRLLALGRLEHQKGFDLLIEAFAPLADTFPDWGLMIVGRGSEEAPLRRAIDGAGLHPRVQLVGATRDPLATLRDSDLFVFPSRYEGFPLTLVEAMTEGLPVVSFDCPAGPNEIITHDVDGLLVPPSDVVGLRETLARAMGDDGLRSRLGAEARVSTQWLTRSAAMAAWMDLLASVGSTP